MKLFKPKNTLDDKKSGLISPGDRRMNKPFRNIIAGVIVSLVAIACATEPPESVPLEERLAKRGFTIGEQVKRIRDYRINGWSSVDRYNVIMNVGASKTTWSRCAVPVTTCAAQSTWLSAPPLET